MKILIPAKNETPNLIFTLFEECSLEGLRKRSQRQVVALSKLLIKESGRLREDSKPTEEESLQLENLRNTLNTQWKEKRDSIAEREVYVCYAVSLILKYMMITTDFSRKLSCYWY